MDSQTVLEPQNRSERMKTHDFRSKTVQKNHKNSDFWNLWPRDHLQRTLKAEGVGDRRFYYRFYYILKLDFRLFWALKSSRIDLKWTLKLCLTALTLRKRIKTAFEQKYHPILLSKSVIETSDSELHPRSSGTSQNLFWERLWTCSRGTWGQTFLKSNFSKFQIRFWKVLRAKNVSKQPQMDSGAVLEPTNRSESTKMHFFRSKNAQNFTKS